jgi:hypothetical protein
MESEASGSSTPAGVANILFGDRGIAALNPRLMAGIPEGCQRAAPLSRLALSWREIGPKIGGRLTADWGQWLGQWSDWGQRRCKI